MTVTEPSDLLKVFISNRDSSCDECGEALGRKAPITLAGERGALCLACADLDHLVFLPSGDAALTRRARKHSTLAAVVLKWSRVRKRYERQGVLVEEAALALAEQECFADGDARTALHMHGASPPTVQVIRSYLRGCAPPDATIFVQP